MDKKSLARYRRLLEKRRDELMASHDKNKDLRNETEKETHADMADMAASAYTREFLYSLSNSDRQNLMLVEAALERIEEKDYGLCIECEEKIGKERLDALPWARYCVNCQELVETGRLRA
ncbi:MAG: TraR/DksA family transcriptional regulator [Rhodospirillales bacterium]